MQDEETMTGDTLTAEEQDMVQQARNSGINPRELVRKAQENIRTGKAAPAAPTPDQIVGEARRQATLAAENVLRSREMLDTVRTSTGEFRHLNLDATDLKQIGATVRDQVLARKDYANLSYEQTLAAIAEETKKECERRGGKKGTGGTAEAARKTAEKRLDNEGLAVDSSTSGGRSAPSTDDDTEKEDDFDGSSCGTGDDKCFAMSDQELSAQYSRKAQGFLKKARQRA